VLGPYVKALKTQAATIQDLREKAITPLTNTLSQMAKSYLEDRLEQMYLETVPEAKRAEISYESLLQAANTNKYQTRGGVPDLRRAYRDLTTKPMTQAEIDAAVLAAEKRGEEKGRAAASPRMAPPSGGMGRPQMQSPEGFRPKTTTSVSAALDEALAAAVKDDSIWKSVDNLAN
jgi:hypothetical protein